MKLSIIIVNYNVRHFLEHCLLSVIKATKNVSCEVFVVDNKSADNSAEMVAEKFPSVKLIANQENLGFSKANNQAIQKAQGEYILLLNPDTIVEEDTFIKCINFMDEHTDVGGLGVKMIDGQGRFLPESKRGLPTPLVAFYKIFGLSSLFPKSKTFSRYHMGFLDEDKNHEIEILSGAYMFLRKSVLDKTGLLDETFFMYGEDIDLSYRIIKAGYKNYYFSDTKIIHYKGESTKKSSINYVFVFYNAMLIFAKKHFSKTNMALYSGLIYFAIYLRAFIAILNRFFLRISLPLLDLTLIGLGTFSICKYYEKIKFSNDVGFPNEVYTIFIPIFTALWLLIYWIYGNYSKSNRLINIIKASATSAILTLLLYALLPENLRFSRLMIISFIAFSFFITPISRLLLHISGIYKLKFRERKRIAIIGNNEEVEQISSYFKISKVDVEVCRAIFPKNEISENVLHKYSGKLYQLIDLIQIYQIEELIFCTHELDFKKIIELMSDIKFEGIKYKIAPYSTKFIIGSNSVEKHSIS